MHTRQSGFTLIELMIVVGIIAILAAIAIPNLLSARLNSNETAAVATIRNLSSAQAQFQMTGRADVDNDGTGEYGFLRELSGAAGIRTNADGTTTGGRLYPPALSGSFSRISLDGSVSRSGYVFKVFLPGAGGTGQTETLLGGFTGPVETNRAETTWSAYAWPIRYENSGRRAFFVNQEGDISATDSPALEGPNAVTPAIAGAAYEFGGDPAVITGRMARGTIGRNGQTWLRVQ